MSAPRERQRLRSWPHAAGWAALWIAVGAALLVWPAAPVLGRGWVLLGNVATASVLLTGLRWMRAEARWLHGLAWVLPSEERGAWRAEVVSVLDAAAPGDERRRQTWGFVRALPVTAITCWWLPRAGSRER